MRLIYILSLLICSNLMYSQIGINTEIPIGIFHIDGKGDTELLPTPANFIDDVIIMENGDVGMGTLTPLGKIDIVTGGVKGNPNFGFRLRDGSQNQGWMLTSDDNGYATWGNPSPSGAINGVRGGVQINLTTVTNVYVNTGAYIDIPPGRWLVSSIFLMPQITGGSVPLTYRLRISFADVATLPSLTASPDVQSYTPILGVGWYEVMSVVEGSSVINNASTANKRYYVIAGNTQQSISATVPNFTGWGEDGVVAFQLQD